MPLFVTNITLLASTVISNSAVKRKKKSICIIFAAIEAISRPSLTEHFSIDADNWVDLKKSSEIEYLTSPDNTNVIGFDDLVEGVEYHALRKFDSHVHRYQVDDENLDIES